MTEYIDLDERPTEAVAEYLRHLGALKRAQADSHRYLASLWGLVEEHLHVGSEVWSAMTLGRWNTTPLVSRDYRAPGTSLHDRSERFGAELKPLDLAEYLSPPAAECLAPSLCLHATDARPSARIDGDAVEITVFVGNQKSKKELLGLPEYTGLARTIAAQAGGDYSLEPYATGRDSRILRAVMVLQLQSVGSDSSIVADGIVEILKVTGNMLRVPSVR